MPLSNEAKKRLDESTNWPRINIEMLHPNDIDYLGKLFSSLIENGMDYTIEDLDSWLKAKFMGMREDVRIQILNIARDVKNAHT